MIKSSIIAATAIIFSACGGGGSTPAPATTTGVFVDSVVAGLNYSCSSGTTGLTNASGEFTCNTGDTVTFLVGTYELGSCTVAATISPYTLYPDNDTAAINLAQLLQTIDSDNDPSNGITISSGYSALDTVTTTPTGATFDTDMEAVVGTLVTEATATAHLNASLGLEADGSFKFTTDWLNGRTLYNVWFEREDNYDENGDGKLTWIVMPMTFTETTIHMDGDDNPYTITAEGYISVDWNEPDGSIQRDYIKAASKTAYRMELCWNDNITLVTACTGSDSDLMYFDSQSANAFIDEQNALLQLPSYDVTINDLAGKKITIDGMEQSYYSNMTYIEHDPAVPETHTGTWSIENGVVIADVTFGPAEKGTISVKFEHAPDVGVNTTHYATQTGSNSTGTYPITAITNLISDVVPSFAVTVDMIAGKKLVLSDGTEINFYQNMTSAQNVITDGSGVWSVENGVLIHDITTYASSTQGTETTAIIFDAAPAAGVAFTAYATYSDGSGNDVIHEGTDTISNFVAATAESVFTTNPVPYNVTVAELAGKKMTITSNDEVIYFYDNMTYKVTGVDSTDSSTYALTGTWSVENGVAIADVTMDATESENRVYVFDAAPAANSTFTSYLTLASDPVRDDNEEIVSFIDIP